MYPHTLFAIGSYSVNAYRLIIIVGIGALLPLALRLARERKIQPRLVIFGWAIAVASALAGGYTIPNLAFQVNHDLPHSWSLGAILAAVIATGAYALWLGKRIPGRREALDILAPCLAFSFVLGRLACFAAGCCNGSPAPGLPWAVTFTDPASASSYKNIPVHPSQLYESAGSLLILLLLTSVFNSPRFKGQQIWMFFLAYGWLRFVDEFFRGDVRTMMGVLSLNQWVSLAAIVIGSIMLAMHLLPVAARQVAAAR